MSPLLRLYSKDGKFRDFNLSEYGMAASDGTILVARLWTLSTL